MFHLTYFFLPISFFLSSFFFLLLTICYYFHILGPISTKLGQKYVWVNSYKSYTRFDLKGHVGVTGVKKVIFTIKVSTPLGYMVWLWDSCIWSSLRPSTKVIGLKNYLGSFGVTGCQIQRSNFKQHQMAKTNSVNMLVLDRHAKVSTVTSSSDLRLRGQRSNKVNFQTTSNDKTNSVNMLAMDKHAKVSTVTSSSDSWLRGQRSKKVKF